MFRFLWIVSWLGLLAITLRALIRSRDLITQILGGLDPVSMSVWQLGLLPFTLIGVVMLILNLSHFGVKIPTRSQQRQLIGMLVMVLWLWLFSAKA